MGGIIYRLKDFFWKVIIYARWMLRSSYKMGSGVGERVPDFTLLDLKGTEITLFSSFPKKAVVLWLTNLCESCERRIPILQRAYKGSRDRLEIIAISTLGNDRETPERILKTRKIEFPLLLDPEDWVGKVLGFEHAPGACPLYNLLILDQSGRIILRHHLSAISDEKFLEALKKWGLIIRSP